jgi:hypothetical protein
MGWRDSLGRTDAGLVADGTGPSGAPDGVVDQLDYNFWKANFGNHSDSGATSSANAEVPETSTQLILVAGIVIPCPQRRRKVA